MSDQLPLPTSAILYLKPETTVIGVTGSLSSGCTTIAEYLKEKHKYVLKRLSDVIRKELGKPDATPEELQDKGDELRISGGTSILAELALNDILKNPAEKIVIDGIRNPGEVKYLRRFSNFFLIGLDGPREERLRRYRLKIRKENPGQKEISDQDFFAIDERDSGKNQPVNGQNVTRCLDLADFQIINSSPWDSDLDLKDNLYGKVELLLSLTDSPGSKRPSMREIGMHIAYSASLKSPCLKRQVGATIAKQIKDSDEELAIAVGYNHPPEGVKDCFSKFRGCYRDQQKTKIFGKLKDELLVLGCEGAEEAANKFLSYPEVKRLDYCQSVHAEESAILQVSKLGGSSLQGTTLYTTTFPCLLCAKSIIQAGISKIVYNEAYPVEEARELLTKTFGGENLIRFEGVKSLAFFKLFQPDEMKG
jgi:deoxycytidylate deaminase/dephospho-CoA kinase